MVTVDGGAVLVVVTVVLLEPVAPSMSVTVAVQWMTSPTEALEGLKVRLSTVLSGACTDVIPRGGGCFDLKCRVSRGAAQTGILGCLAGWVKC